MTDPIRLGVTNQKGGVGKTTDTINFGGAAASVGADVLLVDADPQGYLTHLLGLDEQYRSREPTLFQAFDEPESAAIDQLIVSHDEFDVIPSNVDMFRLEQTLIASGMKTRTRLDDYLDRVESQTNYDFIIVDAPPSLGPINDNVLLATENILIPSELNITSKTAFNHLYNQINTLEARYDTRIHKLGIVVSNIDYPLNGNQKKMQEWYNNRGFLEHMDDDDPDRNTLKVYEIRNRVAIARALGQADEDEPEDEQEHEQDEEKPYGHSIFHEDAEECDQAPVFLQIISDIVDRVHGKEAVV